MTTTTSPALNPKQVHYLKRELITLELEKELNLLGENATLRTLFPTDNPADGITAGLATVPTSMVALRADTPLLRHAFNQYVLTFPLLQDTDRVEFWGKVQRFLDEFRKLQITNSAERTELTRRKKIGQKIERLLVLLYGVGIKVKEGKEESIRVEEELQKVKNKELVAKIVKIEGEESIVKWMTMNGLDINVVTVRDVTEKKHMMEHLHPTIEVPQVPPKAQNIFNRRPTEHHLYRERDRLSLRSFLHRVVADPRLARSEIFIQFLTSDPFKMNHEESYNAERRAEMDQIRADQEKRFKEEVDRKVEKLNGQLEGLKKELMKPGALQ
ncbi:PX-associated-domain-containing protein [Jimgerdemannia flammicorona]|uniref:PX-associated-domain-containing protein n=1 Tax=Jimgerdemannia flammicorona TaxID=994334 RepID=A0A433DBD3_9FUNG|nr:PX-associated-domain-containing protein [Jimgerdemannia flammicorona]